MSLRYPYWIKTILRGKIVEKYTFMTYALRITPRTASDSSGLSGQACLG